MGRPRASVDDRFWPKVDMRRQDECWPWTGNRTRAGYGRFRDAESGKSVPAHRVSLQLHGVVFAPGDFVCHRCDNPPCVNPAHLYVGDHASNMRDRRERQREARGPALVAAMLNTRATGERHGSRTHPEQSPRGERHGMAKLSTDAMVTARSLRNAGLSYSEIGRRLGVAQTTVSRALRGKSWISIAESARKGQP